MASSSHVDNDTDYIVAYEIGACVRAWYGKVESHGLCAIRR